MRKNLEELGIQVVMCQADDQSIQDFTGLRLNKLNFRILHSGNEGWCVKGVLVTIAFLRDG